MSSAAVSAFMSDDAADSNIAADAQE